MQARSLLPLVLAAALAGCACDPGSPERIVLVTVDTLRADHLGAYGYPLDITPFLDSLAGGGLLFERAAAQATATAPSHASLFTGLYPLQHGVHANGLKLDPSFRTLAEALAGAGYRTAAFTSTDAHFASGGLDRGFATYDELRLTAEQARRASRAPQYRGAARTIDAAIAWLAGVDPGERLFLWIHLFDPHKKLRPPAAHLRRVERLAEELGREALVEHLEPAHGRLRNASMLRRILRYDAEIAYVDRELERLYAAMERPGAHDLWIVTSDHGQGLRSHAAFGHSREVYNTQVLVPLLVHSTAGCPEAARIDAPVELVDLAPTLAELAGGDFSQPGAPVQGRSLVPYLRGSKPRDPKPYAFSQSTWYESPGNARHLARDRARFSLQSRDLKYILNRGEEDELYDLAADPHERKNRIADPAYRERAAELRRTLNALIDALSDPDLQAEPVDEATRERLRALGYLD